MRAVVLDFQGTLTPLPNPVAFVTNLKEQGDYVVLWTGSDPKEVEQRAPGLLALVDALMVKPSLPHTALPEGPLDEVVFVDDEPLVGRAAVRFGRGRVEPWRFVLAQDIRTLLRC